MCASVVIVQIDLLFRHALIHIEVPDDIRHDRDDDNHCRCDVARVVDGWGIA